MGRYFRKHRRDADKGKGRGKDNDKGKAGSKKKRDDRPAKRSGGGFKRDREDRKGKDKKDAKNLPAKKQISVAKLREEQKSKAKRNGVKGGKRFVRTRGDRTKGTKKKIPRDPEARKVFLDKEMENYWLKGGHSELVTKRLDDDLEDYFKKKEDEETGAATAPAAKAEEPIKE